MTTGDNYFYTLQEICVLLNLLPNTFRQIAREYSDIIVPQEQVRKGRAVMGLPPEGFEAFRLVVQMRGKGASGAEIRAAVAGARAARAGRPGLAAPLPDEARERVPADPVQAGRVEPGGGPTVGTVGLKAELDEGAWARYREALGADAAPPRKVGLAPARAEAPPPAREETLPPAREETLPPARAEASLSGGDWEVARAAVAEAAAAAEPAPVSGRGFAELPEAYRRLDEPRGRIGRIEPKWPGAEPEATVAEPEATVAEPEATVAEPEATVAEPDVPEAAARPVRALDAPAGPWSVTPADESETVEAYPPAEMAASGPDEPVTDGEPEPEVERVPDTWDVDRAGEIVAGLSGEASDETPSLERFGPEAAGPVVVERALLAEIGSLRDELRQMDEKRQEERDKLITALMRTQHELQSLRYEVGASLSRRDRKRKRGFVAWLFDA
jgi:hypothetical protein